VTSFGLKNPFKKLVTMCQIAQFYACVTHAIVLSLMPSIAKSGYPEAYGFIQVVYQITMIVLFSNFFQEQYSAKGLPGATKKKE
jgi:elongation of very long chain fatty acids protein 4